MSTAYISDVTFDHHIKMLSGFSTIYLLFLFLAICQQSVRISQLQYSLDIYLWYWESYCKQQTSLLPLFTFLSVYFYYGLCILICNCL